jgi:hypothetical protein
MRSNLIMIATIIVTISVGYIVAAVISPSIFINPALTSWASAWTYVVWAASTIFSIAACVAIYLVLLFLMWSGR